MNRVRPPARPAARPSARQPYRGGPPEHYAPAEVLLGLIRQSENRYATYRDLLRRQDDGFGQLQIDAQNLAIALAPQGPEATMRLGTSLDAALTAAATNKALLEQACLAELHLQGELKRWLTGQPPLGAPPSPWGREMYAPVPGGPSGWYDPQAMQMPQMPQGASQGAGYLPQGYPPTAQPGVPPLVDLRDPKAAAEFMKRAEAMPQVGPAMPTSSPQSASVPVTVDTPGAAVMPVAQKGT